MARVSVVFVFLLLFHSCALFVVVHVRTVMITGMCPFCLDNLSLLFLIFPYRECLHDQTINGKDLFQCTAPRLKPKSSFVLTNCIEKINERRSNNNTLLISHTRCHAIDHTQSRSLGL